MTAVRQKIGLRAACTGLAGWPVGTVSALGGPDGQTSLDSLFAVDLAAAADTATARRGSVGRAVLVSSLHRLSPGCYHAAVLAGLLELPSPVRAREPAAARLGAFTTPGARPDAVVVDVGAGTIDVIAPDGEVVAAGAGELLTVAVAETLGVPAPRPLGETRRVRPARREPAVRGRDGSRGFLDGPADPAAAGLLAAAGRGAGCRSTGGTARPNGGRSGSA